MSDGPVGTIFEAEESSVVTGVDYKLRAFRLWNPKVDEIDRPMDGVVENEQLIEGRRADIEVFGDRILTYDVPGQILLSGGAIVLNQPFALRTWVEQGGDVIIDRAGWGQIKGEIEVLSTVAGKVGEYWDLEAAHQVNAKVAQSPVGQRGGTRTVQIIGRTEKAGTSVCQILDAGNLAQDPPEAPDPGTGGNDPNDGVPVPELELDPSVDEPLTVAVVTVSNAADITPLGGDVELEYLVQTATPDPTDSGTPWGPVRTSEGTDELDLPPIPSGGTIWVRGQTVIDATSQRSDWSAWISILLGPDDDGTGGVLPPIDLVLTIDEDGVVSASATGVAAITMVYFEPGTPNGAAPDYAAVLAGTLDASAPFSAPALITLTEGQSVTVGAIGEDALGNRTILVTEVISFGVDTGSGAGTPGDAFITYYSGPPVAIVPGSAVTEHVEIAVGNFYRNTGPTQSGRLQVGVGPPGGPVGPADAKLALRYSRNAGATWRFCNAAQTGPFVLLDAEGYPVPGDYFACDDADFAGDNRKFQAVSYDGDDVTPVEVGNIYVEFTRSATPPATEEPEPEFPSGMIARWKMEEGSGLLVENDVTPGTFDLALDPTYTPTWVGGTDALHFGTGGPNRLLIAGCQLTTELRTSAAFFYIRPKSLPTAGNRHILASANGDGPGASGGDSPRLWLTETGAFQVVIARDTGGGPITVTSSATIADEEEATFGYIHDGTNLTVYVNGAASGAAACSIGINWDAAPGYFIGCEHTNFTSENTDVDIGDYSLWDGGLTALDIPTAADFADAHATLTLKYPGLP